MTIAPNAGRQMSSTRDVPYISIVRHSEALDRARASGDDARRSRSYQGLAIWLTSAIASGFLCGFAAFALAGLSHRTVSSSVKLLPKIAVEAGNRERMPVMQTVVPVTYRQAAVNEKPAGTSSVSADTRSVAMLEEVRTRNRRLEALVKVLRRRDTNDRRESSVTHRN